MLKKGQKLWHRWSLMLRGMWTSLTWVKRRLSLFPILQIQILPRLRRHPSLHFTLPLPLNCSSFCSSAEHCLILKPQLCSHMPAAPHIGTNVSKVTFWTFASYCQFHHAWQSVFSAADLQISGPFLPIIPSFLLYLAFECSLSTYMSSFEVCSVKENVTHLT